MLSPAAVRGVSLECAWIAAHLTTYPLGLLRERLPVDSRRLSLDGLDPIRRGLLVGDVEAAGMPVLMVHGIVDNRSIFTVLRRARRRREFARVVAVDYGWLATDVRSLAAGLAAQVERVCDLTGYDRVHIVAHSMGGMVARYYVQRVGGDERVHTGHVGDTACGNTLGAGPAPSGDQATETGKRVPRRTGGAEPSVHLSLPVDGRVVHQI